MIVLLQVSERRANIVYFGLPGENTILVVPLLETLQMDKRINVSWLVLFTWDTALTAFKSHLGPTEEFVTHRFKLEQLEQVQETIESMHDNSRPNKIKAMIVYD